jgi:hypothetical protein
MTPHGFDCVICETMLTKQGMVGFIQAVEDLPMWAAWFGERFFIWNVHRALKHKLERETYLE